MDLEKITAQDFPLTELSIPLAQWLYEIEEGKGLVLLSGFPVDRYSNEDCEIILWGICAHMGDVQTQSADGERMGYLKNLGDSDYSHQNNKALGLHNDACDLVAMMWITPAKEGGVTGVASATAIYNELMKEHPDELATLCEGFYFHLFEEQENRRYLVTKHKVPIFSMKDGYLSVTYLRSYIEMAFAEVVDKTLAEQTALDTMDKVAHGPRCFQQFMVDPGEILLLNNLSVLHSRTAFEDGDDPNEQRHVLRLWLKAHNTRPLVDDILVYIMRDGIPEWTGGPGSSLISEDPDSNAYQGTRKYVEYAPPVS